MQIIDASGRAISSSDSELNHLPEFEMVRGNSLITVNESFHSLGESPIKLQCNTLASAIS